MEGTKEFRFSDNVGLQEVQSFVKDIIQREEIPYRISLENVNYFDPILLAWIALLNYKFNKNASLIEIIPPKGKEYYKFYQLAILLKDSFIRPLTYELPIEVSSYFSPVFIIDEKNFKFLFTESFKDFWGKFKNLSRVYENHFFDMDSAKITQETSEKSEKKKIKKQKNLDNLKRLVKKFYKSKKLDKEETSVLLYFLQSLDKLYLHRKIIDELLGKNNWSHMRPSSLGMKGLTRKLEVEYEEKASNFLEEYILPQSPFFIYLFSLSVENFWDVAEDLSSEFKNKNSNEHKTAEMTEQGKHVAKCKEYINELYTLYSFCIDLYSGMKELAKNIIEHAEKGAIVTRVYKQDKCINFVDNFIKYSGINIRWPANQPYDNDKKENVIDRPKGIFTAYVVDIGEKGIIRNSINKLTRVQEELSEIEPEIGKIISSEISSLKQGKKKLRHFYDFTKGPQIFHQTVRSAAGLGLLFFSNLLALNRGFMWVSSPNKDTTGKFDSVYMYHKFWSQSSLNKVNFEESEKPLFPVGTSYLFVLPLLSLQTFPEKPFERMHTMEGSSIFEEIVSSIPNISPITNEEETNIIKLITSDRVLIRWPTEVQSPIIWDRDTYESIEKDWEKVQGIMEKPGENLKKSEKNNDITKNHRIFWLHTRDNKLESSDIFHLWAIVELITKTKSIIFSGVREDSIKTLIRILLQYSKANQAIWSADSLRMIFSSDETRPPVIIGGEKTVELLELNQKIARFYNDEYWVNLIKESIKK